METLKARWGRCVLARQNRVTSDVLLSFWEGSRVLLVSSLKYQKQPFFLFWAWRLRRLRRRFQKYTCHPAFARFLHEALWNQNSTPILQAILSLLALVQNPQTQFCSNHQRYDNWFIVCKQPKILLITFKIILFYYNGWEVNKTNA